MFGLFSVCMMFPVLQTDVYVKGDTVSIVCKFLPFKETVKGI